jgi:squalene-associated FAD-dependent desaturase
MKVVVVGAGFAGLAAAIALQERRHQVELLERRGILGGRATSYVDAASGEDVDNGTHLMLGAYRETLDLLRRAGARDLLLEQDRLRLDYVDDRGFTALDCPPLRAPLHLLWAVLAVRMPWRARLQAFRLGLAVRFGRRPTGLTLAEYFARTGQGADARRLLWDPLATAVLNETPERGDAMLFHRVFREAFLESHAASRLVFLRRGWSAVHERLAAYFEARGGMLRRRALAEAVELQDGHARRVRYVQRAPSREERRAGTPSVASIAEGDAIVLACPWTEVARLLPEPERAPFADLERLGSSPIVSVDMWLDRVVVDRALVGLRDSEMEWVFDKGRLFGRAGAPQHLSFIVSAARRDLSRPNAELVGSAEATLRRYFTAMAGASVTRSLVLRDPAATFASTPETEGFRPGPVTPVAGLFLAGDWTNTGLPATIEGAVRSGNLAASAIASLAPASGSSHAPGRAG